MRTIKTRRTKRINAPSVISIWENRVSHKNIPYSRIFSTEPYQILLARVLLFNSLINDIGYSSVLINLDINIVSRKFNISVAEIERYIKFIKPHIKFYINTILKYRSFIEIYRNLLISAMTISGVKRTTMSIGLDYSKQSNSYNVDIFGISNTDNDIMTETVDTTRLSLDRKHIQKIYNKTKQMVHKKIEASGFSDKRYKYEMRVLKGVITALKNETTIYDFIKAIVDFKKRTMAIVKNLENRYEYINNSASYTIKYNEYDLDDKYVKSGGLSFQISNMTKKEVAAEIASKVAELNRKNFVYRHILYDRNIKYESYNDDTLIYNSLDPYGDYIVHNNNSIKNYKRWTSYNAELNIDYEKYNNKKCIPVYLKHFVKNRKSKKNIYNTVEEVEADMRLITDDYTIYDLYMFCKNKDISCYAIDALGTVIIRLVSKKRLREPIICMICNNHIYPVTDPIKRKSIVSKKISSVYDSNIKINHRYSMIRPSSIKNGLSGENPMEIKIKNFIDKLLIKLNLNNNYVVYHKKEEIKKECGEPNCVINIDFGLKNATVYMDIKKISELFEKHASEGNIYHHEMSIVSYLVNKLYIDNITYIAINDYQEDIWKCCRLLGIPIADSYARILQFLKDTLPASAFNSECKKRFSRYSKYGETVSYKKGEGHSIDIRRAYTDAIMNTPKYMAIGPEQNWLCFEDTSSVHNEAMYIVHTTDHICLCGDGIYTGRRVKVALDDGLITRDDIKYYIKASYSKTGRVFKNELKTAMSLIDWNDQKDIINHFIGTLCKLNYDKSRNNIVSNDNMITGYDSGKLSIRKWKSIADNFSEKRREWKSNLYKVTINDKEDLMLNYYPIYCQIIDNTALRVYWKMKDVERLGFTVLKKKVDSLLINGPGVDLYVSKNYQLKKDIFKYGVWVSEGKSINDMPCKPITDKVKKAILTPSYNMDPASYPLDKNLLGSDITGITKNKLLYGKPGTGKTHDMLLILNSLDEKYKAVVVSFTNSRAADISTHVTRKNTKCMCMDKFLVEYEDHDYIFIDEVFFMPISYLYILYKLPGIKIAAGDPYQMIFDIYSSEGSVLNAIVKLVLAMCGTRIEKAGKNYRFDAELYKIIADPNNPKIDLVNKISLLDSISPEYTHIVYYNKTRKNILKMYRNEKLHRNTDSPYICKKNGNYDVKDDGTIVKMYNGMVMKYSDIKKEKLKYFELGFAITCHKAQGKTIKNKVVIHDIERLKKEKRVLYTALTRVKKFKDLYICK